MRLNDKTLTEFACSKDAIDKEGVLHKKGELNRGFQKRWFVLKGNLLFYFEKRLDKQPAGVIVLEDCNVEVCDTTERYSFSISFTCGSSPRTYVLAADSEKVMESWMKAVTLAPYDYTRTVVRELQKRVNRLRTNDLQMTKKEGEPRPDEFANSVDHPGSVESLPTNSSQFFDDTGISKLSINNRGSWEDIVEPQNVLQEYDMKDGRANALLGDKKSKLDARKSLPAIVRRSKSSENLHHLSQPGTKANSKSPLFRRKAREYQSVKRTAVSARSHVGLNLAESVNPHEEHSRCSTFQILHEQYSVCIWTKVKEYEDDHLSLHTPSNH